MRLPNRELYNVTEGLVNQFTYRGGQTACTSIAATALVRMLKGTIKNSADINEIVQKGIEKHQAIANNLADFITGDQVLGWDQCYLAPNTGFRQECLTALDTTGIPFITTIRPNNATSFLQALRDLEARANSTSQSQGAIVIIEPSTYAISISPRLSNKDSSIQFFDSHGSHDFDPDDSRKKGAGALLVNCQNVEDLANYLKWKSQTATRCGMHHCWLPVST
jgi:hypothetical protein